MSMPLNVVMSEGRPSDVSLVVHALRDHGYEPSLRVVESETDFVSNMAPLPDVILADYYVPSLSALRVLELVKTRSIDVPVIVVSGALDDMSAADLIHLGAADYLMKDRLSRLGPAIQQALQRRRLVRELDHTRLMSEETSLRKLIYANADGIVIVDQCGTIRFANPAAEVLLDQSHEDLLNQPFGFPIVEGQNTEIDIVRRGEPRVAEIRVVEIEWEGQRAFLASLRDITERIVARRMLERQTASFKSPKRNYANRRRFFEQFWRA